MNEELILTEEESKIALFKVNQEYMSHPPKERIDLYAKYKDDREKIRQALIRSREDMGKSKTN